MAAATKSEVLAALSSWQDYRGLSPFCSSSNSQALDRCNVHLSNAACLLSMLAAAAEDSQALSSKGQDSQFDLRNGAVLAGALEGIESLVQMGAFLLDAGS